MDILDYERTVNPDWWLRQIAACDWAAGRFLHTLLAENRFHETYGEKARLLLLADGAKLVSFCTYAESDDIPDTELTPWLGFVYTHPDYRGRRLMGRLITRVKTLARDDGFETLCVSTEEAGLYEKYGARFLTVMKDRRGGDSRIYTMDTYGFYGHEKADVKARITDYPGIETPKDLYRFLWHVWKRETCAARMREDWSEDNPTLGQCTITAFLAQDIFGGRVWGVPLGDGNFHCFNAVGDCVFDLTSEQFGNKKLDYTLRYEQLRHDHFMMPGKRDRYEMLKADLSALPAGRKK
jgi:GNAT superfamily N-acetyltransferase